MDASTPSDPSAQEKRHSSARTALSLRAWRVRQTDGSGDVLTAKNPDVTVARRGSAAAP